MSKNKLLSVTVITVWLLAAWIASMSCNRSSPEKEASAEEAPLPFDYNKQNMYVFSVAATGADHKALYADTLGFMVTTHPEHGDSSQNIISWAWISTAGDSAFAFNEAKHFASSSGVQITKTQLFLHPPRDEQYMILEICPYPIVQFPLTVGKEWNWGFNVGSQYSPGKGIGWTGNEWFAFTYKVSGTTTMQTAMGNISCYHIHGVSTSKLGVSTNDIYYSYKYGIVKMRYRPLDSTTIELSLLTAVNDKKLFKTYFFNLDENPDFVKYY